ncbi:MULTISPECIES: hypothetical protein [Psychrobacillus]|uniref:Uncharacterized protein n=1 Tax=Psychrobacillus faecigallinarum TaxID=2762235 RepID=A0ABR8RDD7_9BACI|nr:hypothetical protein [Psychrobacillus faecigallinarum]MBD7945797.1 hypothetical protein [Psychrobacillus faecigallinarum]QGM29345.1 hypothetical protein GI482_02585 [Bacillus sp. N3536]
MEQVNRFLRSLIFNKYDEFANALGYTNWKVAEENTFYIYRLEEDAGWYATELPSNKWAVWNDEGQPPYSMSEFATWSEAIGQLRKSFVGKGLPEEYWQPEGFKDNENVFMKEPDREKKM